MRLAGLLLLLMVSACGTQSGQATAPPADVTSPSAPADPGVAYDLLAHCGVKYADFGGRIWKVEHPVIDPPGEPLARGSVNYLRGTMRMAAEDQLRFTVDGDSQVLPGAVVTFRPTTETPPLCQ